MARKKSKKNKTSFPRIWWLLGSLVVLVIALIWFANSFQTTSVEQLFEQTTNQIQQQAPDRSQKQATKVHSTPTNSSNTLDISGLFSSPDFTWPQSQINSPIVEHYAYTLSYNETYEQANWVAWRMVSDSLYGRIKRNDKFKTDPLISTASAHPDDYKHSGYDRGHLAPAADFSYSKRAMEESFYMSNMSPQVPEFNRGIWKKLEEQTRYWMQQNQELYIVCGPVFTDTMPSIGINQVAVPPAYFKVIYDLKEPEMKAIGFLLFNQGSRNPLHSFAVSVDSIQKLTGLDFFSKLPDALEKKLEENLILDQWF